MTEQLRIRRTAVIGAGVMGAAIAAHLANAGYPCLLLDIKPDEPTDEEKARGLTRDDREVADRIARAGLARARKAKPAAFFSRREPALVEVGNIEDDLGRLAEVDWVIEAVIERLDIKASLYERLARHLGSGAILSTNTSGLSVARLAEALPPERRRRFLVTHFFNPPRYLKLLEVVPGPDTDPELVAALARFGEEELGKGIVFAKDTPNFIANRIGTFALVHGVHLMLEQGLTVAEVDKLTGKAIGRPRSATFRTADLVGLDTLAHVVRNMYENLPDDPRRELFQLPEFLEKMLERGWLGEKSGQGFYKKVRGEDGKRQILMLDPGTLEYVPQPKVAFGSLEMARGIEDAGERIHSLFRARDKAGAFLRENLTATLLYSAACIPEISDDIVNVDRALRWGFGWELGPFESWDALGGAKAARRFQEQGRELPPAAVALLESGRPTWYQREQGQTSFFHIQKRDYEAVQEHPKVLRLRDLKEAGRVILENADASLVDLGEEVACLEFHTKMNTIGPGIMEMMERALDEVEANWRGLVVGNDGEHFSAGANLLLVLNELDDDNWEDVDWMVNRFQQLNQRLRFSSRPVVVAPHGLVLGGGCEVTVAGDSACAAAETYIGLVEVGAGLVPAGGGCKEMVKRVHESLPEDTEVDLLPLVRRLFETIGMARVATSAREGQELGYIRAADKVVMNGDHLLHEARSMVLALAATGYRAPRPLRDIRVAGETGLALLRVGLHNMKAAGYISEHDALIGDHLARILCGGEVAPGSRVDEQYLLDLEREAFMSLLGEPKTLARMEHILKTGKPLRN